MTNFEYIKAMNEEEFKDFILDTNLDKCRCPNKHNCHLYDTCDEAVVAWLKDEYIKD